jgi:hypothetical protein
MTLKYFKSKETKEDLDRRSGAWVKLGLLEPTAGAGPARVDVRSLAHFKRRLDLWCKHGYDRDLLICRRTHPAWPRRTGWL